MAKVFDPFVPNVIPAKVEFSKFRKWAKGQMLDRMRLNILSFMPILIGDDLP